MYTNKKSYNHSEISTDTKTSGLKVVFNIFDNWGVDYKKGMILLDVMNPQTYNNWKKKPHTASIGHDKLIRISYILGIYKALQILFKNPQDADDWINKPNKEYNGKSALDIMLQGNISDLEKVRTYLDYVRGGGW